MSEVQAEGGVVVEASARESKKAKLTITHREGTVAHFHYKFAHGPEHEFVLTPDDPNYHALAVHGLKQILGDAISTKKTPEEGEANLGKRIEGFEAGEWSSGRGEGSPTGGLLARALSNLYERDLADVQNYLSGLGKDEETGEVDEKERAKIMAALRADEVVAMEIERIRPPKKERKVNEAAAKKAAAALAGLAQ